MPVALAYIGVVAIWSTTPLMIQLSSQEIGFVNAAAYRMVLAAWVAVLFFMLRPKALNALKQWRVHGAGLIGVGFGLSLVYYSAQHLPSGLVSVVFALSPLLAGGLAALFKLEKPPNLVQATALFAAFCGISLVFLSAFNQQETAGLALIVLLLSVLMFNVSGVLVKKYAGDIEPMQHTAGTLLYVMPLYLTIGLVFGDPLPAHVSPQTVGAVLYLTLGGSVLGFVMYFYLVRHLSIASVGTVTLITPIIALFLGYAIQNEVMSAQQWLGVALIIVSLFVYQRYTRKDVAYSQ